VKSKGKGAYRYRAVDQAGHTMDFLRTPTRERATAAAFLPQAIRNYGLPERSTIDQSGSKTAALKRYNHPHKTGIAIRQGKSLNTIVEQDQRAGKRKGRPRLGFKSFWAACGPSAGIEVRQAIRKGPVRTLAHASQTPAEQVDALAA